jgi:hypothetical protein
VAGLATLAFTGSAAAAATTIAVDAQQPWAAQGVAVKKGQTIKVSATGRINYFNGEPQTEATPDGSVSDENHCGGPGPCGALIGRIGEAGAPFFVGSEYKAKARATGTFQLGINDFDDDPDGIFDNNSGSFSARVKVEGKGSAEPKPPEKLVATVIELKNSDGKRPTAQVFKDGKWQRLSPGDSLREHARIRTVGDTQMAIELDLGGRVVVRPGSEVRIGERSVTPADPSKEPWRLTKGGVWAKCGKMSDSLEIQMTGGVIGILDQSKNRRGDRQGGNPVGTITSLATPGTLTVTPRGGTATAAQQGQALGLGDSLGAFPGVAARLQLARPSSVGKDARLVDIEPAGGAEPIVSIDRAGEVLDVAING